MDWLGLAFSLGIAASIGVGITRLIILGLSWLKGRRKNNRVDEVNTPLTAVNTRFRPALVKSKPKLMLVRSRALPLWTKLGWVKRGNEWKGFYRTHYKSYRGRIIQKLGDIFQFFIQLDGQTCDVLRLHRQGGCFIPCGATGNWYWVNQNQFAQDVDGGIMEIQRIIEEAFSLAGFRASII